MASPPPLPEGQIILMIFAWGSFIIYLKILLTLLYIHKKSTFFDVPFYIILLYSCLGDIAMFFHVELVMRPRKYRFLPIFNKDMPVWFGYYSYFLSNAFRTIMVFNYIPLALNRCTAFLYPLQHARFWKERNIRLITIAIWALSFSITSCLFLFINMDIQMVELPTGHLQALSIEYFYADAIQSAVLSLSSAVICSILYGFVFMYRNRSDRNSFTFSANGHIEKRLYVCSLFVTIPLFIEVVRSLLMLWATVKNNQPLIIWLTEFWFYWTEIMTTSQCWSLLLVSPQMRKLLFPNRAWKKCIQYKTSILQSTTTAHQ